MKPFQQRLIDLGNRAYSCNMPVFTNFINEAEYSEYLSVKDSLRFVECTLFGEKEAYHRMMIGFGPVRRFPIRYLLITPKDTRFITPPGHRDYLGSILGLGIEREHVGDILIGKKGAVVFVTDTVHKLILEELKRVGRNLVDTQEISEIPDGYGESGERREFVLSSLRLDTVASSVFGLGRKLAKDMIQGGWVYVNYEVIKSPHKVLAVGDTLSVRTRGKCILQEELRRTSKGNYVVDIELKR